VPAQEYHSSRDHDDWRLRPEPSYLDGNFLAIHFGHEIVRDDNVNRMDGSQFQSLADVGSGENRVPKAFEKFLFALQQILVIVDAKDDFPSVHQAGVWAHTLPVSMFWR
jgi:hypothetical protein